MTDSNSELAHQKRLSQILRYVASWHQALNSGADAAHSFIGDAEGPDFYQNETIGEVDESNPCGVLFTTNDFRKLLALQSENLLDSPPFSFYAANTNDGQNRGGLTGTLKRLSSKNPNNGAYWLRLVRLTKRVEAPPPIHAADQTYLDEWVRTTPRARNYQQLLSSPKLIDRALAKGPNRHFKRVLKSYKRYLLLKRYQQTLEPMYNQLFEWIQQKDQHSQELVWSLGHAKFAKNNTFVNGPLLEVLVEVELAPDGALLVKPRQHTGVTLNRQVVTSIASQPDVLAKWHRNVAELIATEISPGQPATYVPLLKQLAVELCPGGSFRPSSKQFSGSSKNLVVSEAWCLYTRLKPSSVWARDASLLADKLAKQEDRIQLPLAAWSLTHGPNVLEEKVNQVNTLANGKPSSIWKFLPKFSSTNQQSHDIDTYRPFFPLETSNSQNQIAEMLLDKKYPAVVTEGPPGTGKTHSIANIVCAYLCQGKRVLVTSKNAPALSVLRDRLPKSVQDLVVDVSKSEASGMRQLQQTVERLANRVSVASVDIEAQKSSLLQESIQDLEEKLQNIDKKICKQSERIRLLLQKPDGTKLTELACTLVEKAPYLMQESLTLKELQALLKRLQKLESQEPNIRTVKNYDRPPRADLLSMVLAKSKSSISSSIADASRSWVSSLPMLGIVTGMDAKRKEIKEEIARITINGSKPKTEADWSVVAQALRHSQLVASFQEEVWNKKVASHQWPERDFLEEQVLSEVINFVQMAIKLQQLASGLKATEALKGVEECRLLDIQRRRLACQIRHHAEELVDATVVAELSRSFSPDAQSALIAFSQIAGAAKFGRSAKPSKMTQRQRRRRQEYLHAFDRCCRFIPCWILTTGQISDYLPPECLFDLVVIDEASQSDVTVLPGMLRGKQWLIVGDGKQVSPTEAFVSEEEIDGLRAALPQCPLERSLMPGHSFFDICAQAFPRGRVVLSEHFRCSPDIIDFSNQQFYDGRLAPLRLPTKSERLTPSLVDVRVNGIKVGKTNEAEANKIVELVQEIMNLPGNKVKPRSIGVISLIGDEQSRMIRGRLLDAVGPEKMARHNVLVGDPPNFQGAERDVVFLSMVCSRGKVPTQSQLMHFQRANVAMSRAKDRCVLVRSIDLVDIPSMEDMKVPIIEFFLNSKQMDRDPVLKCSQEDQILKSRNGTLLLKNLLQERGFLVADMGVVWKNAIFVEHQDAETRAALIVDCDEVSPQEWQSSYDQQKAIERVGWKCFRVDLLSLFINFDATIKCVIQFLSTVGIEPTKEEEGTESEATSSTGNQDGNDMVVEQQGSSREGDSNAPIILEDDETDQDIVTVSSDESVKDFKPAATQQNTFYDSDQDDEINASRFGEVVELDFLRQRPKKEESFGDSDEESDKCSGSDEAEGFKSAVARLPDDDDSITSNSESIKEYNNRSRKRRFKGKDELSHHDEVPVQVNMPACTEGNDAGNGVARLPDDSDSSYADSSQFSSLSKKRRYKYRKLDKYSRDGRWYPKKKSDDADDVEFQYDTDSDLSDQKQGVPES